ncbi:hypothetical protein FB446DRAFT_136580 [Lentinula raphanica]|nr:hypothetical protein FB446DRAFT_136580 [Lentinula raphanica]
MTIRQKPLFLPEPEYDEEFLQAAMDEKPDDEIEFVDELAPAIDGNDDDFYLDSRYYNMTPATPDLTTSTQSLEDEEDELTEEPLPYNASSQVPFKGPPLVNFDISQKAKPSDFTNNTGLKQELAKKVLGEEERLQKEYEDEFAMLEAWLDEHIEEDN